MTANLEFANLESILNVKVEFGAKNFLKVPFLGFWYLKKIILIAYLGQILSDFQNSSLYGKLMKFLLDQCYGRTLAHPTS